VYKITKGDMKIRDHGFDMGKVISSIGKMFLSTTKVESIGVPTLEVSKSKLHHYNIAANFDLYAPYVILGMQNLIV